MKTGHIIVSEAPQKIQIKERSSRIGFQALSLSSVKAKIEHKNGISKEVDDYHDEISFQEIHLLEDEMRKATGKGLSNNLKKKGVKYLLPTSSTDFPMLLENEHIIWIELPNSTMKKGS